MFVESEIKLGFKDVLFRPKRSELKSRSEVSLNRKFVFRHSQLTWEGIPIISANMDHVGTFEMAQTLSGFEMMTALVKHYSVDQWAEFTKDFDSNHAFYNYSAVSTGISDSDYQQLNQIIKKVPNLQFICVDVANGYTETFLNFVKKVREAYPNKTLIAGNIVTGEMAEALILAGADIVKVGIGPGSVCTTRVKTGVGYPQLSAIIECADAAHGLKGHVISDGGCTCPGDVSKAFGAGADFVMIGGMLAGHTEGGGQICKEGDKKFVEFYGMSSQTAMVKHNGGMADYRASEGKSVKIPYKGGVENTVKDILGGVRSTCTYVGAAKLKELSKRTTFIRVAEQENRIFS